MKITSYTLKRIASLLLVILMLASSLLLVACNEKKQTGGGEKEAEEDLVEVLRVVDDIKVGGKFTNDKLQTVKLRADAVPEGAVSDVAQLRNLYARSHVYAGDIVTLAKTTDVKPSDEEEEEPEEKPVIPEVSPKELGYVVVTDYRDYVVDADFAIAVNKAIEENPGKTIYFPDGSYAIKTPIIISADPDKSVSLRFSNNAVINARQWTGAKEDAMIQIIGSSADGEQTLMSEWDLAAQVPVSVIGGCLMANGYASGISIDGGKGTYIYNVSIKSAYYGIHVKKPDNELCASFVNVDNVNVTGYEAEGSVGVLVESSRNTFSNMRIASVNYGVMCTESGSGNIFRNLHPLVVGMNGRYTVGFWDKSDGNQFDICYSDQFSAGFRLEENSKSLIIGGFCFWWTDANDYHVGVESSGKFNGIVAYTKVSHSHTVATDAYLYIGAEDGQGVVLYPMDHTRSDVYDYMLDAHCKAP